MIEIDRNCLDTLTDVDYMLLMRAVQTKNITTVVNTLLKIDLVVLQLKSALLCGETSTSISKPTLGDYTPTLQQQEVKTSLFGYAVQPYQDTEQLLHTSQSTHHELDMTDVLDLSLKKPSSEQHRKHHKHENSYPYQHTKQICTVSESNDAECQRRVSLSPDTQSHFQYLSCHSVNHERWKREINRHISEQRLPSEKSLMKGSYRSDRYKRNDARGKTLNLQKYDYSPDGIRNKDSDRYIFPSRRPMKCLLCSKVVRADNHIVHMRRHTGEKPYKCPVCPFRTANPSSMPKHRRLHDKGKAIYRCRKCSYTTVSKDNLTVHEQSHHVN